MNRESELESLDQAVGQAPLLPPREPAGARLAAVFGRHHALLTVLCVTLLWAIVAMPPLRQNDPYQVGAAPGHDVMVPQQRFVADLAETQRRRDEAARLVTPNYDPDPNVPAQALWQLAGLCDSARRLAATQNGDDKATVQTARWRSRLKLPEEKISDATITTMRAMPAARWSALHAAAQDAVRAVYRDGLLRSDVVTAPNSTDLAAARQLIGVNSQKAVAARRVNEAEAGLAGALAAFVVSTRPNQVVNEHETRLARRAASEAVPEVFESYAADDVLVRANEIVTQSKFALMQELGIVTPRFVLREAMAQLALIVMLVGFSASFLKVFHARLVRQPAQLWLTAMVPVAFAFVFRLVLHAPHAEYIMMPVVATAAMLLTVLINARIGVVCGFVLASVCGLMTHCDAAHLMVTMLASWIGVLSVADISSRGQIVRAGALTAAANAALIAALDFAGAVAPQRILTIAAWEAGAGVASVALMAGLAMLLERPFGITTHLRLMELLAPDEDVLRRMQSEAPGTYTHSLMVALLSESAAKKVGADALLCRVGALYHDIGKLRRPHCFIENQIGHNIHDELSPQLSALIILAHVKDGLELGRALRLPQPVLEIIEQHHGITVLSYFYNRALQGAQSATIPAADVSQAPLASLLNNLSAPDVARFRYAGPRPQSKEAAIVMLADSIEASSRALPHVTPETLREHIRHMIAARLTEGELSECELTLRDMGTIEEAFIHVLRGALHQRIQYPEAGVTDDATWMGARREVRRRPRRPEQQHGTSIETGPAAADRSLELGGATSAAPFAGRGPAPGNHPGGAPRDGGDAAERPAPSAGSAPR